VVFETRKINTETLGEYLKAVRTTFNLTLEEASKRSEVNIKLLSAVENSDMKNLPADVYVLGALKHLAKFYQLNEKDLIEQYKKERHISKQILGNKVSAVMRLTNFWKNFVFTPKVFVIIAASMFVVFTLIYLFWQVSSINRTPQLHISEPADQQIINSLSLKIVGQTDPGVNVQINGQEVFVDNQGKFSTDISLVPGPEEIKILAKNRFGKETNKSLKVFSQNPDAAVQNNGVNLKLVVIGNVSLTYAVDDLPLVNKALKSGDSLLITAKEKLTISSSDGGLVTGELNGQALGMLGKKGEILKDLVFFK
jgi:transcriptional regulator with XRE-family HTH domain